MTLVQIMSTILFLSCNIWHDLIMSHLFSTWTTKRIRTCDSHSVENLVWADFWIFICGTFTWNFSIIFFLSSLKFYLVFHEFFFLLRTTPEALGRILSDHLVFSPKLGRCFESILSFQTKPWIITMVGTWRPWEYKKIFV